jgi:hypothetical protein
MFYRQTVSGSLLDVVLWLSAMLQAEKWTDSAPQRHGREYRLDSRQESVSIIPPQKSRIASF